MGGIISAFLLISVLSLAFLFRKKIAPRLLHRYLMLKSALGSRIPTTIPWNTVVGLVRAKQSNSPGPIRIRIHTSVWVAPRSQRPSIAARSSTGAIEDKHTPEMAEAGLSTFPTGAAYISNETVISEESTHSPASASSNPTTNVQLAGADGVLHPSSHAQHPPGNPLDNDLIESNVKLSFASHSSSLYRTASEFGSSSSGSEEGSHKSFYAI